jgi:hypothetical protein
MIIDHWWTNASQESLTVILAKVRAMWDAACGDENPPIGSDLSDWELNALASLFVAQREALKEAVGVMGQHGVHDTMAEHLLHDTYPMDTAP